jgi:hypothetical protein
METHLKKWVKMDEAGKRDLLPWPQTPPSSRALLDAYFRPMMEIGTGRQHETDDRADGCIHARLSNTAGTLSTYRCPSLN